MIGAGARTKKWDAQLTYGTPGIGDGLPGVPPYIPDMGDFTPARLPMAQNGSRSTPGRMAFRGPQAAGPPLDLDMAGIYQAAAHEENPGAVSINAPASPTSMPSIDGIAGNQRLPKPGFFSKDGGWRDLVGALADGLAGLNGQPGPYAAHRAQERQRQQQLADYQRRRDDDWRLWERQQNWKQDHPDDQFTQYLISAGIDPQSAQGRQMYKQRAEGMAAPPLLAVDGFDAQGNPTKTFLPRPTFSASSGPSGPAVGTVKNGFVFKGGNPNDQANWERQGGAGSGQQGFR